MATSIAYLQKERIAIVGPDPTLLGGTAAFIRKYISLLANERVNYELFHLGFGDQRGGVYKRIKRLYQFLELAIDIVKSSCNIIHCHAGNFANLIGFGIIIISSRISRKRVMVTLHGGDLHFKLQKSGFYRAITKGILAFTGAVSTVNEELAKDIRDLGIQNVVFIPNSFSFAPEKERLAAPIPFEVNHFIQVHSPILVSIGAMERIHGIDITVRAVKEVMSDHPNVGVVLIAYKTVDPVYRNEIIHLMNDLCIAENFCIPASLPDVFPVLNKANIFIRATRTDGDAISIREALSLGIPVIASDTGFRPEGTYLFAVGDPYALAEQVRALLSIPKQNRFIGYDDQSTLQQYINLYHLLSK